MAIDPNDMYNGLLVWWTQLLPGTGDEMNQPCRVTRVTFGEFWLVPYDDLSGKMGPFALSIDAEDRVLKTLRPCSRLDAREYLLNKLQEKREVLEAALNELRAYELLMADELFIWSDPPTRRRVTPTQ